MNEQLSLENISLERAEKLVLENVKFAGIVLQEMRKRNKELQANLGHTYAKIVGLGVPYEEGVNSMRKVKKELDEYLVVLRDMLANRYKREAGYNAKFKKKKRKKVFPNINNINI